MLLRLVNDFGDIATLSPTLSATTVIGAVNEINNIAIAAVGFILSDGLNTQALLLVTQCWLQLVQV